jgi:hypothetical protein
MVLAGIKVPDTVLVRDAIDLSRSASEPFLFNHAMRSWLFGVLLSETAERAPDAELLAVSTILHDLGLTDRYGGKSFRGGWRQCGALVSEGARHLDAADASCLGCHRASYHTIHRSSQRARSRYDPFGNNGGCFGGRP